jgi:DNA polymerase
MTEERHGGLVEGPGGVPMRFDALEELRAHMGDCTRCSLCQTRTKLVFGVGDPAADLMFVGEAPGRNEDLQGEPFVGAAGKLLDELLASIGLNRSQVYIANVLKCRPPGNRDPLAGEIETCTPFLSQQVRLVSPTVIATLGNFATKYILGTDRSITSLRGRLFLVDDHQVVPIFHPAAALYSPDKKQVLFDDFRRLKAVIDRGLEPSGDPGDGAEELPLPPVRTLEAAASAPDSASVATQPSLF